MNTQEVAQLLGYASTLDTKISADSEMQVRAWAGLLHDVPAQNAKHAIDEHYRRFTDTIMPADIVGHYRVTQQDHAQRAAVDELTQRRATIAAAPQPLVSLAERFARVHAERRGDDPDQAEGDAATSRALLAVPCPYCQAGINQRCTTPTGRELTHEPAHPARLDAVQQPEITA